MKKQNLHIEIVSSTKLGLSSMSRKSRQSALAALQLQYARVGVTTVDSMDDLERLVALAPDIIFLGMKFLPRTEALGFHDTNKMWLSQYLDEKGLVYTGSNSAAHELELNKENAKRRVAGAGLATARFMVIQEGRVPAESAVHLGYPVFIKPTNRGGGMGIDGASVAYNYAQLCAKAHNLHNSLRSDVLVEEYLSGREFSVAVLKRPNQAQYDTLPLELIAPADAYGKRFLSSAIKSADSETSQAVTDVQLRAAISELAKDVFTALGGRDYGRIDIRLDANGVPHFLEANLLPSLLEGYGNFPKACLLNQQLSYKAMLAQIVELAASRLPGRLMENPDAELKSLLPLALIRTQLKPGLV